MVVSLLLVLVTFGCAREVGDNCETNADCGTGWMCDTSQPGGYCTLGPCTEETCPSEAVCVRFTHGLSYCMRRCNSDLDCRHGYVCVRGYSSLGLSYPGFCDQAQPPG